MSKPIRIGVRMVPIYQIPVTIEENDNDWEFVFVKGGWHKHGKGLCNQCLVMAVF